MNLRHLLIIISGLIYFTATAQVKTLKTSVYFDNNKSTLRKDAKKTLSAFFDTLQNIHPTKIVVKGNTDNSADSLYNMKLSQHRTESVKNYIMAKGFNEKLFSSDFFGENKPLIANETEEGKQKNRRVDVVVYYRQPLPKKDSVILPEKLPAKKDSCRKDTLVTLPGGTQIIMNACELLDLKNCIEFREATSAKSILANGMALMDTGGIAISSCGMLKVSLMPECKNECFRTPIKVRFPVPAQNECDYCGKNARVYLVNAAGDWSQPKAKSEIKLIKVKGVEYYQFEMNCPNIWKNCDCKITGKKVKFKTKRGYKIKSVTVSYECPVIVVSAKQKRNKQHVFEASLPCPSGKPVIKAEVVGPDGRLLILEPMALNDLPKKVLFPRCGKDKDLPKEKAFRFIPVAGHTLYKKYYIKSKYLKVKP